MGYNKVVRHDGWLELNLTSLFAVMVGWNLTSLFSTNMAISETNGTS